MPEHFSCRRELVSAQPCVGSTGVSRATLIFQRVSNDRIFPHDRNCSRCLANHFSIFFSQGGGFGKTCNGQNTQMIVCKNNKNAEGRNTSLWLSKNGLVTFCDSHIHNERSWHRTAGLFETGLCPAVVFAVGFDDENYFVDAIAATRFVIACWLTRLPRVKRGRF